jgi:NADPH:quinone reductase-like Zn-dependent oxidoreductase
VVNEGYAYRIPAEFSDEEAAPLLCAGIIGYRALRRAQLPPGVDLEYMALVDQPTSSPRSHWPMGLGSMC